MWVHLWQETWLDSNSQPDFHQSGIKESLTANYVVIPAYQLRASWLLRERVKKRERVKSWRVTDVETQLGGHIGYILVNPAIQTRPWQSGSIYLTHVENQAPLTFFLLVLQFLKIFNSPWAVCQEEVQERRLKTLLHKRSIMRQWRSFLSLMFFSLDSF